MQHLQTDRCSYLDIREPVILTRIFYINLPC